MSHSSERDAGTRRRSKASAEESRDRDRRGGKGEPAREGPSGTKGTREGPSDGAGRGRSPDRVAALHRTLGNAAVARAAAAARERVGHDPETDAAGDAGATVRSADGSTGTGTAGDGGPAGGSGTRDEAGRGSTAGGARGSGVAPRSGARPRSTSSTHESHSDADAPVTAGRGGPSSEVSTAVARPATAASGRPLPGDTRTFYERQFGRPLDGVRLHTGPQAAAVAGRYDAAAVTTGRDVLFGEGQYRPHSAVGRGLLTHELAHASQHARPASLASGGAGSPGVVGRSHPMEREASAVTRRVAAGRDAGGVDVRAPPSAVARQVAGEQSPPVTGPVGGSVGPAGPTETGTEGEETAGPAPLDLQGAETVDAAAVAERLPEDARRGTIPVRFGSLASGQIEVRRTRGGEYSTRGRQSIPLTHPGLAPLADAPVTPALVVDVESGTLSGFASLIGGQRDVRHRRALVDWMTANPALMGWVGMDDLTLSGFHNAIEGGQLVTRVEGFGFELGGFMDGTGTFELVGDSVGFDATAQVRVAGLEESTLAIQRTPEGTLAGSVEVPVAFDAFSGTVLAEFGNGTVSMEGTASYTGEKFDGSVTLLVTHRERAENIARERLGPDAVQASAEEAAGEETEGAAEPAVGPRPGPRAVAGYGNVTVNLTEWLAGSADVIVDANGEVTVVGQVAPPAEITLFEQKEYVHEFPRLEVRAIYGVPVVGNLNVFANVGVDAIAKLGPGTLYDITLDGTYSTDPQVYQNYSLAATLNVSAFAGVRIRAEGGVGVTIVAHDLRAGVGIQGTAGIQGYVEARPTIGYREHAAPEEGKTGEFYIAGHMEIAARPSIALGGDLFVELDSPVLSPAPDKTWTWPVGELVYPLPGEFGIGADVDYVLGSGTWPDVEMGEVDFDSQKFMTDLMNDNVPRGGQGEAETQGTFEDEGVAPETPQVGAEQSEGTGTVAEPPAMPRGGGGGQPERATGGRGRGRGDEGEVPSDRVQTPWLAGVQELERIARQSDRDPLTEAELERTVTQLKREYGFTTLRAQRRGEDWQIVAAMNPTYETQWEAVAARIAEEEAVAEGERRVAEERFGEAASTIRGDVPQRFQTVATAGSGRTPQVAAGGGGNLSPEQARSAISVRVAPITESRRGAHAEATVFESADPEHTSRTTHAWLARALAAADTSEPVRLYADNRFCGRCRRMIEDAGGRVVSDRLAEFTRATEPEDMAQSARIRGLVDVNNAHSLQRRRYVGELRTLPGIGRVRAERIREELVENGRFAGLADLAERAGLSESVVEGLRDSVSFGPANAEMLR